MNTFHDWTHERIALPFGPRRWHPILDHCKLGGMADIPCSLCRAFRHLLALESASRFELKRESLGEGFGAALGFAATGGVTCGFCGSICAHELAPSHNAKINLLLFIAPPTSSPRQAAVRPWDCCKTSSISNWLIQFHWATIYRSFSHGTFPPFNAPMVSWLTFTMRSNF